jgi:hypothetical protein
LLALPPLPPLPSSNGVLEDSLPQANAPSVRSQKPGEETTLSVRCMLRKLAMPLRNGKRFPLAVVRQNRALWARAAGCKLTRQAVLDPKGSESRPPSGHAANLA